MTVHLPLCAQTHDALLEGLSSKSRVVADVSREVSECRDIAPNTDFKQIVESWQHIRVKPARRRLVIAEIHSVGDQRSYLRD